MLAKNKGNAQTARAIFSLFMSIINEKRFECQLDQSLRSCSKGQASMLELYHHFWEILDQWWKDGIEDGLDERGGREGERERALTTKKQDDIHDADRQLILHATVICTETFQTNILSKYFTREAFYQDHFNRNYGARFNKAPLTLGTLEKSNKVNVTRP